MPTRFDPLTYIVTPTRHAVSGHHSVPPAAASFPGAQCRPGRLAGPVGLSLGVGGAALLGIAIAEFHKTE